MAENHRLTTCHNQLLDKVNGTLRMPVNSDSNTVTKELYWIAQYMQKLNPIKGGGKPP